MNRRVLAALVTLADLHRAEEDPTAQLEISTLYGRHGVALRALEDADEELYQSLAKQLCEKRETIEDDPVGAELLRRACSGTLPYQVTGAEACERYAHLLAPRVAKGQP
jgi:hypothetical protein